MTDPYQVVGHALREKLDQDDAKPLQTIIDHLRGIRQEVNDCTRQLECSECPGFVMTKDEKSGLYARRDCKCIASIQDVQLRDEMRYRKASGRPHCMWTGGD